MADIVLVVHCLFVLFVVGSLPVIWVGAWLQHNFVRNYWFRMLHLSAILFVVTESLAGVACPLTTWENELRQIEIERSFIQQGLHQVLYYDLPESVLTVVYIVFAGLVVATFKYIPANARKS